MKSFFYDKQGNFRWGLVVFLIALALRLLFFSEMTRQLSPAQMAELTPDVQDYFAAAKAIVQEFDLSSRGVVFFGPGYPLFLALVGKIGGFSPHFHIIVQLLLSAWGAVLVSKFAWELTGDSTVSGIAGLLNACSITSISLANILLSETLFFVLLTGGALVFVKAVKYSRRWLLFWAALIFSYALLVRSMGQFLFVPLIFVALAYWRHLFPADKKAFVGRMAGVVGLTVVLLLVNFGWSAWNAHRYGFSFFALSAPGGMAHIVRLAEAKIEGISYEEAARRFEEEIQSNPVDSADYYRLFIAQTKEKLSGLVRSHPLPLLSVYFNNMFNEINNEWGLQGILLPQWKASIRRLISWSYKKGLNYRVFLLTLLGFFLLLRRKEYRLLVVLLSFYLYFALIAGFSHWQSNRIFYPAQMSWAVAVAYSLQWGYRRLVRFFHGGEEVS